MWVRVLGEVKLRETDFPMLLERRAIGESSSHHVDEICMREGDKLFPNNFQTHDEQHLILYFETEHGAQVPHSLMGVLPSIGANPWADTVPAFLTKDNHGILYSFSFSTRERM